MAATPLNEKYYIDSKIAHKSAIEKIYPKIWPNSKVTPIHQDGNDADKVDKIDVIVTIENPGHSYPFKTTIQERWRSPGYSNFRDITITAVNTNSGKPAEFYEGRFEYMLYGYYDQINDKFGEVVFVNFPRLRQMFSSGLIVKGDGNNGGEKNQDFFTFRFDELIKFGCVDWSNVKGFEKQLPPYKVKPDHWERRYYEEAKTAEYWRQVANNNIKSIKT